MKDYTVNQKCDGTFDTIEYIIISTDEEGNILNLDPRDYREFNKKYNCTLSIVYDDNKLYFADYIKDKWIVDGYDEKQRDFLDALYNYKKHPVNFWEDRFVIFELNCNKTDDNFNLNKTFNLLSGISQLGTWRIWSCYHADFKTYRKNFHAVYVVFDAEGG